MPSLHGQRGFGCAFAAGAAPISLRRGRAALVPPRALLRATGRRRVAAACVPPPGGGAPARTFKHIGWGAVEEMCSRLAAAVKTAAGAARYDVLLAVTRGGMVPATILAQALEVRNVLTATVIFYTDEGDKFYGMSEPRFLAFPNPERLEGKRVLVVDDVWDSGRTAVAVRQRVVGAAADVCDVCVLHYKEKQTLYGELKPTFFAAGTDDWIVYPWERMSPNHEKNMDAQFQDAPIEGEQEPSK